MERSEESKGDTNNIEDDTKRDTPPENITYYYSKFNLFDDSMNFYFIKYQIFKKKLRQSLGQIWEQYANLLVFKEDIDATSGKPDEKKKKTFLDSQTVLKAAIEVWLELRKEIHFSFEKNLVAKSEDRIDETVSDKFQDHEVYENFEANFRNRFSVYSMDQSLFKAVLQGFFATANQKWKETLLTNQELSESSDGEQFGDSTENLLAFKDKIKKFTKNSSHKIIKPLLIAREKIRDYFGNQKRDEQGEKRDEQGVKQNIPISEKRKENSAEGLLNKEDNDESESISKFQSNFEKEAAEEIKGRLKSLSLSERPPAEEQPPVGNKKRRITEFTTDPLVQIKNITTKAEKLLNPIYVNYASEFIERFKKRSLNRWQVARGFVTNIIEVNYNLFTNIENKISNKASELKDKVNIRFLQPATDFYHHLMKIWLIVKTNNMKEEISFSDYLEKVKLSMGNSWSEKYFNPTHVFFETLFNEWNQIKIESENEETLRIFIKRVRENLLVIWEENIVKKVEAINNISSLAPENNNAGNNNINDPNSLN